MKFNIVLLVLIFFSNYFAQTIDIIPQLKKVEAGEIDEVKSDLEQLKSIDPTHPDVIFLEAVVTENGEESRNLYELIYNNFPKSRYADASLFRSFSYYYALGLYTKAGSLKERLKKEYPNSPYLKKTEREFPVVDEMIVVDTKPIKIRSSNVKKFTVQAGAFSEFQNAESLKKRFNDDGLTSRITPKKVNNIHLHIVTVGTFANKEDAESFLSILENNYSIKGRVIDFY